MSLGDPVGQLFSLGPGHLTGLSAKQKLARESLRLGQMRGDLEIPPRRQTDWKRHSEHGRMWCYLFGNVCEHLRFLTTDCDLIQGKVIASKDDYFEPVWHDLRGKN